MNRQTRRRALLGGLAVVGVGATGAVLDRTVSEARGTWLRPTTDLAASGTWAFVRGVREGDDLACEVALRERGEAGRRITLFPDTDDPADAYMPPLRSFWRFEVPAGDRSPGEYTLRVGDATLPVEFVAETPPHHDASVHLTPRVTWRSPFVAHARGYATGDGAGRVHVAVRERTADPPAVDELAVRTPEGDVVGRHTVPAGVRETAFRVDPLTVFEADAELVGYRGGVEVDAVPLLYH